MTMAKLAIAAAALFCLFTVSLARPPPRLTADSVTALRLPSEPIKADEAETDPNFAVVSAVPLTEITFRPVNRRFHVKRPCRGRHHHHFKLYPTMMRKSEPIPFGNDMIGENSDFEQPIPGRWTRVRNHHLRQRQRRREESDSEEEDDDDENRVMKRAVFKRFDYDRFDREKRMTKLRQRLRIGNERKEDEMPGFIKGVRKFLTNYF
ncbi:hypothetical protein SASPL_127391 [Salvia splendens]|uniref:Uncharacterized protein n=1 Tax=Salvia splendens TaxID=180675 RepID=A0A8X8ZL60_SALSN|nr:hypothetical protein SASPL_127391 [Salvia splendens]